MFAFFTRMTQEYIDLQYCTDTLTAATINRTSVTVLETDQEIALTQGCYISKIMASIQHLLFGDPEKYNYGALCMPTLPWVKTENRPAVPFYGKGMPSSPEDIK